MSRSQPSADSPIDLLSLDQPSARAAIESFLLDQGEPMYRLDQIMDWLYARGAESWDSMSNLGRPLRALLANRFHIEAPEAAKISVSADSTAKHLWKLHDGEVIESVLIPSNFSRLTLCMSSQAGCAMACAFCATGWAGFRRQLSTAEIVAQYRGARNWALEHGYGEIANLVFMGMGEPLANRKALFPALELLNKAYGVGARKITVSTVGVVPGILELAAIPEQFRLALSLHAPNSTLRKTIIPVEAKWPLEEIFEALRVFDRSGGKRITFEYIMIDGVNDSLLEARQLASLVREFTSFVNLIPFNPIPGTNWEPSPRERIFAFRSELERRGVEVQVRTPRGRDIAAACGQLRAEALHPIGVRTALGGGS